MDEILNRIDALERNLVTLLQAQPQQPAPEGTWLDAPTFCRLVGIRDRKSLSYLMAKGLLHGPAIRNVGTILRPRYRFHRVHATDQFLNRSPIGLAKPQAG